MTNTETQLDPVSAFAAHLATLPEADRKRLAETAYNRAVVTADDETFEVQPEDFDFDSEPALPDYLVGNLFERRTVNITSGDTGSAKSIWAADLTHALLRGGKWFGRSIPNKSRVLYLDEENPKRVVHSRLRALGITNADKGSLKYFRRKGVQLGDPTWDQWLREQCETFRPDLIVVDTAMAATAADTLDNDSVVKLYKTALRPVAEEFDTCIVVLHHERKPGAQESRGNGGHSMMGARQWAGQADVHTVLTPKSEYVETPRDDGGFDTHKEFTFQCAKGRDGVPSRPELFTVEGVKMPRGEGDVRVYVLVKMTVTWGGAIMRDTVEEDLTERILRAMAADSDPETTWTRADIAKAVGEVDPSSPSGTFKRAWKVTADKNWAIKSGRSFRLSDEGRKKAAGLGLEV